MRDVSSKNPISGYLNINSLINKIVSLKDVITKVHIDILCIDETKLDDIFPDSQVLVENYHLPPFEKRVTEKWMKNIYVRQGSVSKRLKSFESKTIENF